MKNTLVSLGIAMAASLFLTDCTKQIENPAEAEPEGIPFKVTTVLTRTTNDGMGTRWAKNDGINLFHSESGATTYVSDGKFVVDEDLAGVFTGSLPESLDADKTYDWYAFYPYKQNIKTPANTSSGYVTVGGASQVQEGHNSMSHVCGEICPLYGTVKGAGAADRPAFIMKNLSSVICIQVTNKQDADLTVSNIAFTSTEDIVGDYYISFAGTPVYTGKTNNVSNTAILTVTGGEAIAKDASANFYIVVKPHTAALGSTLKLSVNGVEKTVTLSADKTFEAGKIKTLKINYNPTSSGLSLPFAENFDDVKAAKNETTRLETTSTLFTEHFASKFISFENVYYTTADGVIRVAGSSDKGIITTKPLDLSKASRVTIKAKDYVTSGGTYDKSVIVVTVNGKEYTSEVLGSDYKEYAFDIPAASSSEVVTIAGKNKTNERFYIDSIEITER